MALVSIFIEQKNLRPGPVPCASSNIHIFSESHRKSNHPAWRGVRLQCSERANAQGLAKAVDFKHFLVNSYHSVVLKDIFRLHRRALVVFPLFRCFRLFFLCPWFVEFVILEFLSRDSKLYFLKHISVTTVFVFYGSERVVVLVCYDSILNKAHLFETTSTSVCLSFHPLSDDFQQKHGVLQTAVYHIVWPDRCQEGTHWRPGTFHFRWCNIFDWPEFLRHNLP